MREERTGGGRMSGGIHLAAQQGDMSAVQELVAEEPELVNHMDRCGHIPLIYAARSNEVEVARYDHASAAAPTCC